MVPEAPDSSVFNEIAHQATPCSPKRQRVNSPPIASEVHSPASDLPDLVSSGGDDEFMMEDSEDSGPGVDWQAEYETDQAVAEEFARRIAAIRMGNPGGPSGLSIQTVFESMPSMYDTRAALATTATATVSMPDLGSSATVPNRSADILRNHMDSWSTQRAGRRGELGGEPAGLEPPCGDQSSTSRIAWVGRGCHLLNWSDHQLYRRPTASTSPGPRASLDTTAVAVTTIIGGAVTPSLATEPTAAYEEDDLKRTLSQPSVNNNVPGASHRVMPVL